MELANARKLWKLQMVAEFFNADNTALGLSKAKRGHFMLGFLAILILFFL
jgi:hypothetical protein